MKPGPEDQNPSISAAETGTRSLFLNLEDLSVPQFCFLWSQRLYSIKGSSSWKVTSRKSVNPCQQKLGSCEFLSSSMSFFALLTISGSSSHWPRPLVSLSAAGPRRGSEDAVNCKARGQTALPAWKGQTSQARVPGPHDL